MEFSRENKSAVRVAKREGYQRHLIRFAKNGLSFDGERVDLVLFQILFQAFWVLTEKEKPNLKTSQIKIDKKSNIP